MSKRLGQRPGLPKNMPVKKALRYKYEANDKARKFIELMDEEGKFGDGAVVPGTDDHRAKQAMTALCAVAFDSSTIIKDKLSALRTILDFTKEKPASKQKLELSKSEEFLLAVEADLKAKDAAR